MIRALTKMLDALVDDHATHIEQWFVFCAVWALGGSLGTTDGRDYRKEFSRWWTGQFKSSVK